MSLIKDMNGWLDHNGNDPSSRGQVVNRIGRQFD